MRYTYFEIRNFKGIKRTRINLDSSPRSRIFPLVGLNESGKTTLLDAISSFQYGAQNFEEVFDQGVRNPESLIPVAEKANFNSAISVSAGIELDQVDVAALQKHMRLKFSDIKSLNLVRKIEITEQLKFENSRYKDSRRFWTLLINVRRGTQRKDRLARDNSSPIWLEAVRFLATRMMPIRYFPNFLFDFPDRIYLESAAPANAGVRGRFYRDVFEGILQSLDLDANLEQHVIKRAKSSDPEDRDSLESLILEMGRSVTNRVFGAWNEIFPRKVIGKAVALNIDTDDDGHLFVRFRILDDDGYFAVSERSLGFRWFFVYLLLTSYSSGGAGQATLFLFDEPASNLHQTAQTELLRSFTPLTEKNWVVYTTHSHHMINLDWLESTFVVRNAGAEDTPPENAHARRTDIQLEKYRTFAASHPNQATYIQPILDVLDYRPAALPMAPDVVMVEGKNDYYTLRFMQVQLGLDEPALLPGTGSSSLDSVIRLYSAWAREFVILLDSDGEGAKQKARYKRVFEGLVAGRVFTLGDIDKAWVGLELEELFLSSDRLLVQGAAGWSKTTYSKRDFNRGVQEAALRGLRVPLSAEALDNFRRLLAYLSAHL
jgi:ABC-type Mn2+/Zn2+ transport system ATPase subunit